jgi:hypothetical protein
MACPVCVLVFGDATIGQDFTFDHHFGGGDALLRLGEAVD